MQNNEFCTIKERINYKEILLSDIVESIKEAIIIVDEQANIVFWNHAAEELFEYSREEVLEENLKVLAVNDESLYGFYIKISEYFQPNLQVNGMNRTIELNAKNKNGRELNMEISLTSIEIANNRHVAGVVREISERRQLEIEKREKEEQIRMMLESIPNPGWLISKERRILQQNKAAESIFGTKIGDYCWNGIHGGKYLLEQYKEAVSKSGISLPGAKCYFCCSDEALSSNEPVNIEAELLGGTWNIWWIPLKKDVYLHYAADVTRYKKLEDELRILSETDVLTKAYNRRYFLQKLEEEMERTKKLGSKFCIIMLDIDHFKKINDNFGHSSGDLVLKALTELVSNRIREIDTIARWGGEEFAILLPGAELNTTIRLAEEVRKGISEMEIPGVGHVTASFGVAKYCPGDSVDSLLNRADNLMYEAKAAGRNRVCYINNCG